MAGRGLKTGHMQKAADTSRARDAKLVEKSRPYQNLTAPYTPDNSGQMDE